MGSKLLLECRVEASTVDKDSRSFKTAQSKRAQSRRRLPIGQNQFEFAQPFNVGSYLGPIGVFLSDLRSDNTEVFAKGLINRENGIDAHPWYSGTGDHINTTHIADIGIQFVHLLDANASKMETLQELKGFANPHRALAIYDSETRYQSFLELGPFTVRLLSLKPIRSIPATLKTAFAFEAQIVIDQSGRQCAVSTLKVCPVFMSSRL